MPETRRARRFVMLIALIALVAIGVPARAQDAPAATLSPGLALTVQPLDATGNPTGTPDARSVRMIALHVPAGSPGSSFVAPGRFRATWTGNLNLKLRERFAFVAFGRGKLTVNIDGKDVLAAEGDDLSKTVGEEVRLKKGANAVTVTYYSPVEGDATVRLYWQQKAVRHEPIPPTVLTHDAQAKETLTGDTARTGRALFADLRCAKCHVTDTLASAKNTATGMPEMGMDAPSLQDVGSRLRRDWLARWIDDPQALRPGAHMPRVFKDGTPDKPDQRALDIATYLASLVPAANAPEPPADARTVQAGGKLYASLFCVACHSPPDAPENGTVDFDKGRIPHRHVAEKFTPAGLRAYLLKPDAHYAWNPMPNFHLSEAEAAALAAYLTAKPKPKPMPPVAGAGDAKTGEALLSSSGCYNCHPPAAAAAQTLSAPSLAQLTADKWTMGCMAENPTDGKAAPHYALLPPQRKALRAFAATDRASLTRDTAAEFSARQWTSMRCNACHARDADQPAITTALADEVMDLYKTAFPNESGGAGEGAAGVATAHAHGEGEALAPDQRALPLMTWAGEKLRPEWTAGFIKGEVAYKPRPYLRARMPAFPARAAGFAHGFAAEHGFESVSAPPAAPDPAQVPLGQRLVGQAGGFSCVQCHSVGRRPPLAPFEAPAINFAHVTERLRHEYYHRWMWNPIRVDPGTKMPQFGDYEGVTAIKDVHEGDAAKQYQSIWQYLLQGKDVKPPG